MPNHIFSKFANDTLEEGIICIIWTGMSMASMATNAKGSELEKADITNWCKYSEAFSDATDAIWYIVHNP